MEVAPGIHRIEGDLGERYVCQYLLVGDERTLLVDTGLRDMPEEVIAPYLARSAARSPTSTTSSSRTPTSITAAATGRCAPPRPTRACCAARPTARGSSPTR